jgi:DNA-binding IclR family transcriptional regulator
MKMNKKPDKSLNPDVTSQSAYIVPAVDRAVRLLLLLKNEGSAKTIPEISDATGWSRSSIYKLLFTLHYHGLVDRDSNTKRYSLGSEILEFIRSAFAFTSVGLRSAAKPYLRALVEYSRETAALSVLRGTQMTFLDLEESPEQLRISLIVGMSTPATTTSYGKVALAYLPEERAFEIIRIVGLPAMTKRSITKIGAYRLELATARKLGYAIDFEEYRVGIVGVSAPILDSKHHVLGALSVVGPATRMTKEKARQCGQKCAEMAAQLSDKLR